MDTHPIHLHGNQFVDYRDGRRTGAAVNVVSHEHSAVGVAQAKVVEFETKHPGDWMIHCHLPHHMMNSMMDLLLRTGKSPQPI